MSRRILIVEDNEAAAIGLARLLRAEGFEVTNVGDATAALVALESEPHPDYLLTDLQLPDLDGRELARRARELSPTSSIALMTGWDIESLSDDPARWGIDWVIAKPIEIHTLLDRLNGR